MPKIDYAKKAKDFTIAAVAFVGGLTIWLVAMLFARAMLGI